MYNHNMSFKENGGKCVAAEKDEGHYAWSQLLSDSFNSVTCFLHPSNHGDADITFVTFNNKKVALPPTWERQELCPPPTQISLSNKDASSAAALHSATRCGAVEVADHRRIKKKKKKGVYLQQEALDSPLICPRLRIRKLVLANAEESNDDEWSQVTLYRFSSDSQCFAGELRLTLVAHTREHHNDCLCHRGSSFYTWHSRLREAILRGSVLELCAWIRSRGCIRRREIYALI